MTYTVNAGTVANVLTGIVGIRMSTVDTFPLVANQIGYTEDGQTNMTYTPEVTDIKVAEERNPIKTILTADDIMFSFQLAEATLANLNRAMMGADNDVTSMVRLKDGSEKYQSLLLEGEAPGNNSGIRQVLVQKAGAVGAVGTPFTRNAKQIVPCQFRAFVPTTGQAVYIFDVWDFTLATGSVAYVAAKLGMRLASETAGADDLDTITGAAEGNKVLVMCADATQAITLKDAASGANTFGLDADIILDDRRSWVELIKGASQWTVNASEIF